MTTSDVVTPNVVAVAAVLQVNKDTHQQVWHVVAQSGVPPTTPRDWPTGPDSPR